MINLFRIAGCIGHVYKVSSFDVFFITLNDQLFPLGFQLAVTG